MTWEKQVKRRDMSKAKILYIEKHLFDVTLDSLILPSEEKEPTIKAFRLENVSLLLARSAVICGVCPLGIPKGWHEEPYEVTYEGGDSPLEQAVGGTVGKFCKDSKDTWKPFRVMCDSTSITVMGTIKAYGNWIGYLKQQALREFDEVASVIESKLGLPITSPKPDPEVFDLADVKHIAGKEWLGEWFKNYETYRSTLKKGVCVYALPYELYEGPKVKKEEEIRAPTPLWESKKTETAATLDEIFEEDIPEDFGAEENLVPKVVKVEDFFEVDLFGVDSETTTKNFDVGKLIKKARNMGEEPTTIHASAGNPYVTMEQLDQHIQRSKAYQNKVKFTEEEKQVIIDHFSFLVGKTYFEGIELARKEGMDLVVERIEGFTKNKFPNERAYQLRVSVRDPKPVTSVYPSELGVIVSVNGLVGM